MAVKTTFSKDDFTKILSNYDLGECKKSKPFKTGAVQTNLLLVTYDLLKMVIFMSIGWFIDDDDDYYSEQKKIEFLNLISRKEFYNKMFNYY